MIELIRSLANNKYIRLQEQRLKLSDTNTDRRNKVEYLDQADKDKIFEIEKRLSAQEKVAGEVQKASNELKSNIAKIKQNLEEAFTGLKTHGSSAAQTAM